MKNLEKIKEIEARRMVSDRDALVFSINSKEPFREITKLSEIEIDADLASLLSIEVALRRCDRVDFFRH
ncbi:MAG: hypothetical protein ABIG90_02030 [bacterium]